jgi:hypothetical protein
MRILMHTPNYVDSMACTIADGLLDLGHRVWNTKGKLNYGEAAPDGSLYDIYFMADTDDQDALRWISRAGHPRVIVHAHDRWTDYLYAPNSPVKPVPRQHCDVMFVRDLDTSVKAENNQYAVYPLDYGIERRYQEACAPYLDTPREPKVIFYGTISTARRTHYLSCLANADISVEAGTCRYVQPDNKWSEWIHGRYTHDPAYYKQLCTALFGFAPLGAGASCFRHMEVYAAGCIPVIQKYPEDIIPLHNFVDGENCILWGDEKELVEKVEHYLDFDNVDETEALRRRCYEFGQTKLLSKHVAQYMLEKIGFA